MQPKIALIFCIAFVIYLFWNEGRKRIEVSNAIWIPLIWIMYCGSRSVSYWIYPETFMAAESNNTADGNPVDRFFLICLMASGIVVLWRRDINWQESVRKNRWIIALFIYLGISVLWSDFIDVSFKRWVRTIGDLVMALIVVTERDPLEAIRRLLLRCSFVLIPMSVLLVKYFHDLGISYDYVTGTTMWIGVTTHKNQLGQLSCVLAVVTLWYIMSNWQQRDLLFYSTVIIFLMALWLLKGPSVSTSKTSVVVFSLASLILIISSLFKKNRKYLGRFVLSLGVTFYLAQFMSEIIFNESLVNLVVTSSGRDMTFTGRTYLWDELLKIAARHPFLGVGFGGFWIGDRYNLWEKFPWIPESAHNGFLDLSLDVGIIGLIILFGVIIITYKNIVKTLINDFEYGRIGLIFLVVVLLYNLTESSFAKPTNFIWFIFLLFAVRGSKKVASGEILQKAG